MSADNFNTRIEYQLSPEMAEAVAVEQAMLMISARQHGFSVRSWLFPFSSGILVGTLFAFANYASVSKAAGFSLADTITAAVVGFPIGLFYGWFAQGLYDNTTLKKRLKSIKQQGRLSYEKLGPKWLVSWDSESIGVQSAASQSNIKWRIIDKIVNGKEAIHILIGNQIVSSVPKTVLHPNFAVEELIKDWESHLPKADVKAS